MNLQKTFSSQDAPKLAIAGVLILTMLFGARFAMGRVSARQETQRTIQHMNLEMGRTVSDDSEVPESTPGEGDPNFVW